MRPIGIFLIIAALLVPLYWYVGWIAGPDGSAMFSQYIGSVSIIAMGISMMLSTRIMGLEPVFGALVIVLSGQVRSVSGTCAYGLYFSAADGIPIMPLFEVF